MTTTKTLVAQGSPSRLARENLHLVCGSGGSRAILASAGFVYAIDKCGLKNFSTIGGVSGGSIPSLMYAAGLPAGRVVQLAVDIDFSSMLTRRANVFKMFLAFLLKERLAQTRPREAVLGSEKLESFIDELLPVWPEKYWTMAVAGKTQVVFTSKGVFQYLHDGSMRQISDKPGPLGLAVCASCAVPGIIDPKYWQKMYLFDGALSWDGQCPIGVVVRDMGAKPSQILACDVGDREGGLSEFVNNFWRFFCGRDCVWPEDERDPAIWEAQGSTVVMPKINKFASLQFTLSSEQKWGAVMAGYADTITMLWKRGVIDHNKFEALGALVANQELFKLDCKASQ
ncbi:MAG: patatin-like phospholipase family protein [Candidatus Obscuribacterales bacterium]|nr:patatin-like phospholipase family protein [Candidatus Obscuribacterales bacterium]